MNNSDFYIAAATVIPLLLIAVMATRSMRRGELQTQPIVTLLSFGLPVIGEVAAFSFLFFAPLPTGATVVLAIVTWAGLLSQLALGAWWLAELIRQDSPSAAGLATTDRENLTEASTQASPERDRPRIMPFCEQHHVPEPCPFDH